MAQRAARRSTRERHEQLLRLLREGTTQVEKLAAVLAVSPSTVRRDLGRLTEDRKVARTYGGAVVPDAFHERPVGESALVRRRAKAAVAEVALELVPDTGAVFVDAGTTCAALARRLAEAASGRALVATRGLETAAVLAESPQIDVVMLGGQVRPLSHGLVGPLTDLALDRLSFSVAFLGADAVDPHRGVGEPTLEETAVKERVAARADRVVVLADSTKLAVADVPAWAELPGGWTLVTDGDAPADLEDDCAAAGVTLLRAGGAA
ncbi:DeoR/GlpR family DNA-binding transcription regulator [Streptomyces lycii]|uniref:DeoR/GlpR transcriptional regulator n=1 Tax=Streptomyces lycii TaxID=2654337 RepID=A0ABQ7FMI6_9ACTN|nr:DeoR/GlpR family DNA-binding transcription regulator [Streptomyces lycii]KAF4408981.1 DeoR/GlpR transcriptional regulator [Streptomyces lycii]